jgi:nucleoprotein TPR
VSANQHADLLDKIQQINLLRESNATLRLDSEANLKTAQDLQAQLRAAREELNPIREQTRVLQAEVDMSKTLIMRLEDDNRRLKDRTEQILSKVKFLSYAHTFHAHLSVSAPSYRS